MVLYWGESSSGNLPKTTSTRKEQVSNGEGPEKKNLHARPEVGIHLKGPLYHNIQALSSGIPERLEKKRKRCSREWS